MSTYVIQYATKSTDAGDDNQQLVENVFNELKANDPGGMRYAAFRLADGVTFVHVVIHDTDDNPLEGLPAFHTFTTHLGERIDGHPSVNDATLVGSYRFTGQQRIHTVGGRADGGGPARRREHDPSRRSL
jgi:hypothetical protein